MIPNLINHDAARKEVDAAAEKIAIALKEADRWLGLEGYQKTMPARKYIRTTIANYRRLVPGGHFHDDAGKDAE